MRITGWRQICCRRFNHVNVTRATRATQQFRHGLHLDSLGTSWLAPHVSVSARGFKTKSNHDHLFFDPDPDTVPLSQQQSEEAILQRASIHGIDDAERLAFEAELGPKRKSDQKLVYDRTVRQDLDLWAVLLDYRRLKDGPVGVRAILNAMLYGGEPVKLQTDLLSDHIWRTVLPVVMRDEKLFYALCHSKCPLILDRPFVFTDVVGWLLVNDNIRLAVIAGTQLLISHFKGRGDLLRLFEVAMHATSQKALRGLCDLISRLPQHRIYADVVPKIWAAGRLHDAFAVHRHLVSLGDLPTQFDQLEPLVQELAARQVGIEPFIRHLESNGVLYSHQTRQAYALEKARRVSQPKTSYDFALHYGPGVRPVKLSDQFVARTFATRSVSFDFILNGLRFIGLFEIGPMAVREIALASDEIDVLKKRFQQLEKMNVDLGASSYVRVIRNLCLSNQQELLRDILESDMHFEVFEDVQTQKRLLAEYYRKRDWPGVNRTLAILNEGRTNQEANLRSARLILQACLIIGDWRAVLKQLDDLRRLYPGLARQARLAPLRMALRRIWAAADAQQRRADDYLVRSEYLTGMMQLAQMARLQQHPWQWRSVVHAIGRSGNWDLCKSLIMSLARMYQKQSLPDSDGRVEGSGTNNVLLAHLFDGPMQASIIELGLISDDSHQGPGRLWLQGVETLFELSLQYDSPIDYDVVVGALTSRLLVLFDDPDPKVRRQFVVTYLRYFNWAWRHCAQLYKKELPNKLYQRGWRSPTVDSVRLLRLRTRLVQYRRAPLVSGDYAAAGFGGLSDGNRGFEETEVDDREDWEDEMASEIWPERSAEDAEVGTTVFYEDLLHPSFARLSDAKK